MKRTITLVFAVLMLVGCAKITTKNSFGGWYETGTNPGAIADVFYIVSTNVVGSYDENGKESYLALLTDEERATMDKEFAYVRSKFGEDFNFYAPYYHQYTLNSISLPESKFMPLRKSALKEVAEAFNDYYYNRRGDHDFVIIGFSQGAMHTVDLLKQLTDEQYSHCIAAYSLGYRLSEEDLSDPHITAAYGESEWGTTISFNSVANVDAIWPALTEGAVTCINPVNWVTDATPASLVIDGVDATVHVDTTKHVLIVEGINPADYAIPSLDAYCKPGNLHLGDLLFYSDLIGANAKTRLMNNKRILVGTYGENIHELIYNQQNCTFRESALIPATNASYLTLDGSNLYAVSENGGNSGAYSFMNVCGTWKQTAQVSGNGADPCYILADNGKVLTADYTGGALSAFQTNDGILGDIIIRRDYDSAHIHQVKVLPFNPDYLVVSDLGNSKIRVLDRQNLTPVTELECGSGAGPRHMEFDLAHQLLLCITELSGEVIAWKYSDNGFTEVQRITADEVNAGGSADIHISPDGRFLYTSHRLANDGISVFSISNDGTLTKIGYRHTGVHPRNFIITPDGSQMIVACRDTKTLEVYGIDRESGLLSEMLSRYEMETDAPVCIIYE